MAGGRPSGGSQDLDPGPPWRFFILLVMIALSRAALRPPPRNSKSRFTPQMTRKPNTQNRAQLMCLSGQPALKVRLVSSSKRDANKWALVVNAASTDAAVWAERTCEVAGNAAQNARAVL